MRVLLRLLGQIALLEVHARGWVTVVRLLIGAKTAVKIIFLFQAAGSSLAVDFRALWSRVLHDNALNLVVSNAYGRSGVQIIRISLVTCYLQWGELLRDVQLLLFLLSIVNVFEHALRVRCVFADIVENHSRQFCLLSN